MKKVHLHKFLLVLLLDGMLSVSLFGQSTQKLNLHHEIIELTNSNPNQAIKIAQHLISNPGISIHEKIKVNLLLSKAYFAKGDYSSALVTVYEQDQNEAFLTNRETVEFDLLKAAILRKLSLLDESKAKLKKCEQSIENITDEIEANQLNSFLNLEKAKFYLEIEELDQALQILKEDTVWHAKNSDSETINWSTLIAAKIYLEKKELHKSKTLYERALQFSENSKSKNLVVKTYAISGLAAIYFLEKEHQKAATFLEEALKNSEILTNLVLKEMVVRQQVINYLALNDTINYKKANKEFTAIYNEVDSLEQDAINVAYNLISEEHTSIHHQSGRFYFLGFYGLVGFLGLIFLVGLLYYLRYFQKKQGLDEIIRYLEITRNNLILRYTEKEALSKETPKKAVIPSDTEELILSKLKRFEASTRFTHRDISLAVLAGQLDTNTKYLSEIINTHYNVNFNTYINKLRINYLVEKLKSDSNYMNYKISYLAKDCGFSSHSSFATVFKSITGISPVTFIELLKEEKQAIAI